MQTARSSSSGLELLKNNFNLIRLIAATQVAIVHSCNHFGYSSAFIKAMKLFPGVPLFFFISGYLIGTTFFRNYDKGLVTFFRNRVLRLYPALILCVLLSTAAVFFLGYLDFSTVDLRKLILWVAAQMSIGQVYNPEFMRGFGTGVLNGSLWTITVEVQFYLLVPVLNFLFKKARFLFFLLMAVSLLVNLYTRFYLDWSNLYMKLLYVSFLPWVYIFMIGFLVSIYGNVFNYVRRLNIYLVLVAYIASMFLVGSYEVNSMNSINPLSVFLLTILILKVSQMSIFLPLPLGRFIDRNDLSYGVYIYHMPIINVLLFAGLFPVWLSIVLAVVLSFCIALISWRVVEKPFLRFKHSRPASVPSTVKML